MLKAGYAVAYCNMFSIHQDKGDLTFMRYHCLEYPNSRSFLGQLLALF